MPDGSNPLPALLDNWPEGRPVGLLALSKKPTVEVPSAHRWWTARAENMVCGPDLEAPFGWMQMIEAAGPAAAESVVRRLASAGEPHEQSLLVGAPMPRMAEWMMRAMHLGFRWLPSPRDPGGVPGTGDEPGPNPTRAQVERCDNLDQDHPVLVLNLNLHRKTGVHPDTGEQQSGRAIADNYFRRGIPTLHRLGARAVWAGGCRGSIVDGLAVGQFDQIGLILYPSRASFAHLLRIGASEGWDRFRTAGLERSWIAHCRITGSSTAREQQ